MINTIIQVGIGCALAAVAVMAHNHSNPPPVAVDVQVLSAEKYPDRVEVMLTWYNQENCQFDTLSTMQGSYEYPDALRTPIDRDLGKPKGPRGKGKQATVKPWVFYRPATVHAPEFIMTAWHDCNGAAVPSTMLVVPIREWFPE
jgi:hypothetical protein